MPPRTTPSYPPELYPHSKTELDQILTDYYSLTLEVETLQRHILKIQTENQRQHQIFNDQVEKLKLYIDQCENQIKKRQERELALIQRLKELQISRYEDLSELKFSRNSKKQHQDLINQLENLLKEKQTQWNHQRMTLIKDNESLMLQNLNFGKQITQLQVLIQQITTQKSTINSQLKKSLAESSSYHNQITHLTQSLQRAEQINQQLQRQNQELKEIHQQTERRLSEKQKILPISSSCPNCLKLSKLHEIQLEKRIRQNQSLRKDIQCLLAFFDTTQ